MMCMQVVLDSNHSWSRLGSAIGRTKTEHRPNPIEYLLNPLSVIPGVALIYVAVT